MHHHGSALFKRRTMGHKLIGRTLPTASRDAVIGVSQDESALILIKYCRDMKQQEARLRLITLLLLLSCTALFCFTNVYDLRQQGKSEADRQWSAAERSPAYSTRDTLCIADHAQNESQKLRIDHRFVWETNMTNKFYIKWAPMFGDEQEKHDIVIPETGFYFVYARFLLRCQSGDDDDGDEEGAFNRFFVELYKWNKGYNQNRKMTEAWDGVMCPSQGYRTVFVGQLFDLLEGDHVKVWIEDGYSLISTSSFGAFLQ